MSEDIADDQLADLLSKLATDKLTDAPDLSQVDLSENKEEIKAPEVIEEPPEPKPSTKVISVVKRPKDTEDAPPPTQEGNAFLEKYQEKYQEVLTMLLNNCQADRTQIDDAITKLKPYLDDPTAPRNWNEVLSSLLMTKTSQTNNIIKVLDAMSKFLAASTKIGATDADSMGEVMSVERVEELLAKAKYKDEIKKEKDGS